MAVSDQYREQGLGIKLIDLCLSALKTEGILKSHIHVLESNKHAKHYWLNRGWIKRGDLEVYSYINSENPGV